MSKKSRREMIRARQRREQIRRRLIWGGLGGIVVLVVGFLVWNAVRPGAGEAVAVMANARDHISNESVPGPYSTNPPTSGAHFETSLPARFYESGDLATLPQYPEGYLVHNLEHGYVIFWYNCQVLDLAGCDALKAQIRSVISDFNGVKLIAFPWESIDEPVVMTSWGRIQRFQSFDSDRARAFIRANRNRAPEPQAP